MHCRTRCGSFAGPSLHSILIGFVRSNFGGNLFPLNIPELIVEFPKDVAQGIHFWLGDLIQLYGIPVLP